MLTVISPLMASCTTNTFHMGRCSGVFKSRSTSYKTAAVAPTRGHFHHTNNSHLASSVQQFLAPKTNQNETAPTLITRYHLFQPSFFPKLKFFMKGAHFENMEHINKHTTEHLKRICERDFHERCKPWTTNTDIC
jgi:hypothetical protein